MATTATTAMIARRMVAIICLVAVLAIMGVGFLVAQIWAVKTHRIVLTVLGKEKV